MSTRNTVYALPLLIPQTKKGERGNKGFKTVMVRITAFVAMQRQSLTLKDQTVVTVRERLFSTSSINTGIDTLAGRLFHTNCNVGSFDIDTDAQVPELWIDEVKDCLKLTSKIADFMYEALYLFGFLSAAEVRACRKEWGLQRVQENRTEDRKDAYDEIYSALERKILTPTDLRRIARIEDQRIRVDNGKKFAESLKEAKAEDPDAGIACA
jgi:hypothetical protein